MENRNGKIRTLILIITAALFVVSAIALLAFLGSRDADWPKIALPPEGWQSGDSSLLPGDGFVTVTTENAGQVVENLKRPDYYHHILAQTTTADSAAGRQTTDIWFFDGVWKIITTTDGQTRHVLTDGKSAYLWYRDESWRVESVVLPEGISPDDLAGILTYESIVDIPAEEIVAAEYVLLTEQSSAPCLYVETQYGEGSANRFWVDLATGLLCRADCFLDGTESYHLEQTGLSILEQTDENLLRQMLLPDGTDPFSLHQ